MAEQKRGVSLVRALNATEYVCVFPFLGTMIFGPFLDPSVPVIGTPIVMDWELEWGVFLRQLSDSLKNTLRKF